MSFTTFGSGTSSTSTGSYYQPQPRLYIGQQVRVESQYFCGSCKQTVKLTATVAGIMDRRVALKDMEIPDQCDKCYAPKPFLYAWEAYPERYTKPHPDQS